MSFLSRIFFRSRTPETTPEEKAFNILDARKNEADNHLSRSEETCHRVLGIRIGKFDGETLPDFTTIEQAYIDLCGNCLIGETTEIDDVCMEALIAERSKGIGSFDFPKIPTPAERREIKDDFILYQAMLIEHSPRCKPPEPIS